jgi:hypothetical protein
MKAWTVIQPLASLIVIGAVPYWMASLQVPAALIGERVVVCADVAPCDPGAVIRLHENVHFENSRGSGIKADLAGHLLTTIRKDQEQGYKISRVPLGCGIGTVVLGRAVPVTEIFPNDAEMAAKWWAWPLSVPTEFIRPVLAKPIFGEFWDWPAKAALS